MISSSGRLFGIRAATGEERAEDRLAERPAMPSLPSSASDGFSSTFACGTPELRVAT